MCASPSHLGSISNAETCVEPRPTSNSSSHFPPHLPGQTHLASARIEGKDALKPPEAA